MCVYTTKKYYEKEVEEWVEWFGTMKPKKKIRRTSKRFTILILNLRGKTYFRNLTLPKEALKPIQDALPKEEWVHIDGVISFPMFRLRNLTKTVDGGLLDVGTDVGILDSVFDEVQEAIQKEEEKMPLVNPKSIYQDNWSHKISGETNPKYSDDEETGDLKYN